ncbi:MAG TPA: hypothetical protein VHW09_26405 [Bryobacteraceae bacterium]|jgi:hypothetical protein|nr:hypothetical protein [Bryobacteraceae bacterium]
MTVCATPPESPERELSLVKAYGKLAQPAGPRPASGSRLLSVEMLQGWPMSKMCVGLPV